MKNVLSATIGAAALATTPVHAQVVDTTLVVRVGIIDVKADTLPNRDKNTKIEYREFAEKGADSARWATDSGYDHGQLVAGSFLGQIRDIDKNVKVHIFAANAFEEKQVNTTNNYLHSENNPTKILVNWEGVKKAVDWFKQNNVKVILTSFASGNTPEVRDFADYAKKQGMVLFASAGNHAKEGTYPAKLPDSISIASDDKDLSFSKDPKMATWVKFTMDGNVHRSMPNTRTDKGSSFSSAKAAAFGAYYSMMNPQADQMQIEQALKDSAVKQQYEIGGIAVTALKIVPESVQKIREIAIEDKEHYALAGAAPSQESEPPSKANKLNQVLAVSLSRQNGY
jgi:hypothetical protein